MTAISKGKGFQGGVRRHGFHGGPKTHGQSDRLRGPGSISSGTTPGRVRKGKRMAGHMGADQVSVKNLEVVGINKAENLLIIKGAVPGATGSLVRIIKLGRIKGYIAPPEEKIDEEEQEGAEKSENQAAAPQGEQPQDNPADKAEAPATETPTEEVKTDAS